MFPNIFQVTPSEHSFWSPRSHVAVHLRSVLYMIPYVLLYITPRRLAEAKTIIYRLELGSWERWGGGGGTYGSVHNSIVSEKGTDSFLCCSHRWPLYQLQ